MPESGPRPAAPDTDGRSRRRSAGQQLQGRVPLRAVPVSAERKAAVPVRAERGILPQAADAVERGLDSLEPRQATQDVTLGSCPVNRLTRSTAVRHGYRDPAACRMRSTERVFLLPGGALRCAARALPGGMRS